MSEPFNGLTPAEAERLALLLEEMGEAQQAIGKILRHGYESVHPDTYGPTNRRSLERELGDVWHAMDRLTAAKDVDSVNIARRVNEKAQSVQQYMHHQGTGPYVKAIP